MSWLALAAIFQVLAQAPAPHAGFDRTLAELQGRNNPATARQDLERFNQSFDREFASSWNARPPAERRALLNNTMGYLGAMRGLTVRDVNAGVALSNAYRRVARFQEGIDASILGPGWAMGPVYGYQNSALILTQLANQNPDDPYVRGQLVLDVGRIRALGGSMPIMVSVPVGGGPSQRQERGIPNYALSPAGSAPQGGGASSMPPLPSMPYVDIGTVPAAQREAARNAIDRFAGVLATATQAQEALRPLQDSVNAMGFTLHPDTVRALTRMRVYLDMAAREIESARYADSLESLGIAEGEARKALKVVGR
jgi:hypothetical protein